MEKVLVVEDEALIRMTVVEALEDAGFDVVEAASADEAVRLIERHDIGFLFTDIQMPGKLDGVDLAHAVAARFPQARIVVASGRLTGGDVVLPSKATFLAKPYDFSTVVARLGA